MPRKAPPKKSVEPDWYLQEWMLSKRMNQTRMAEALGMPTNTFHGIYHGRTSYYRDLLNQVASALSVQPYELLMLPETANAIRRLRADALHIVESTSTLPAERTGTDG